ncbi:STAS domain-containing protein [Streptomyces collinus]|uniref:STAS domain-containing protein n=1 Tax=Streptomyces collinus TaxID=42684 RepID=UPI0036A00CD6
MRRDRSRQYSQLLDALNADDAAAQVTVVDLSGVTFMDSSGINALITAHHTAQRHGGRLRLAAPSRAVSETLGIVGIPEVIPCHPTLREALAVRPPPAGRIEHG